MRVNIFLNTWSTYINLLLIQYYSKNKILKEPMPPHIYVLQAKLPWTVRITKLSIVCSPRHASETHLLLQVRLTPFLLGFLSCFWERGLRVLDLHRCLFTLLLLVYKIVILEPNSEEINERINDNERERESWKAHLYELFLSLSVACMTWIHEFIQSSALKS